MFSTKMTTQNFAGLSLICTTTHRTVNVSWHCFTHIHTHGFERTETKDGVLSPDTHSRMTFYRVRNKYFKFFE